MFCIGAIFAAVRFLPVENFSDQGRLFIGFLFLCSVGTALVCVAGMIIVKAEQPLSGYVRKKFGRIKEGD